MPPPNKRSCRPRGTFCQQRQKVPKERRQNQGFEILSAAEVPTALFSIHHANRSAQNSCLAFASSLRLIPRRAPRLCCPGLTGRPLRLSCGAMWASRPTQKTKFIGRGRCPHRPVSLYAAILPAKSLAEFVARRRQSGQIAGVRTGCAMTEGARAAVQAGGGGLRAARPTHNWIDVASGGQRRPPLQAVQAGLPFFHLAFELPPFFFLLFAVYL